MSDTNTTLEEAKKVLEKILAEEEQNVAQEAEKEETNEQEVAQAEEEFDADKASEQFDATRAARKEAMGQVEKILSRAASGRNVDKKETLKCLRGLYMVTYMQDMLLVGLMGDLINAIRGMGKVEVDQFNTTAKLFTVTQALYKKGLVSQEDMEKIHQEITVPQLMANLKAGREEREED